MKKILLPTDFSENSINAILYAIKLFSHETCTFYLLNTYTPVVFDNEYVVFSGTQPVLSDFYKKNARKGLDRVLKKIRPLAPGSHEFETISAFNLLTDEIVHQVKEKMIDLVVMGTKGATGADEILFGTHTVHALKKTHCPLLAIPSQFPYREPREILLPSDYEAPLAGRLDILKEIAAAHHANLHFLHAFLAPELTEKQKQGKQELAQAFHDRGHHFYGVSKKSVPQAIYDFQEENTVDMLVMLNNKHSFFDNLLFRPVINEIGFHVKVPFLVLPPGK